MDALVWALTELMVEGGAGWGMLEYYRRLYEKTKGSDASRGREPEAMVTLRTLSPARSCVITLSGRMVAVRADGTVEVSEEDAKPLTADGWARVDARLEAAASSR